jgi:DNA-binding MarR family transcriptional regulator
MIDGEQNRAEPATFLKIVEFRDTALLSFVTSAIIVPAYDAVKRDFGIIRAEYMLLLCLSHFPVLTAQDVSRLTGRPRNSISRAVHRMLKEGFIERAPDPDDGRQSKLTITPIGREMHSQVASYVQTQQDKVLDVLQLDERKTLVKLLRKTALYITTL